MSRTKAMTELDDRLIAAAEAELQQVLSIEPSPEFAAKVRARIHERREHRGRRWAWIGLAVATAAALIVTALLRTNHPAPGSQGVEIVARPDVHLDPAPPKNERAVSATTRAVHPVATATESTPTTAAAPNPEIVIDAAMTEAIRRMAMSLRNAEPDVSAAEQVQMDMGEPAPLAIAEPLNVPELVLKPADHPGGDQE
jgi:hypothetical protein